MFNIIIKDNYDEVSSEALKVMKEVVKKKDCVLGLATGSSPVGLYKKMIADHKSEGTSYKDIRTFNLDEYVGLPRDHEQSYYTFMHEQLFNHIDIPEENVHVPVGCEEDEEAECVIECKKMYSGTFDPANFKDEVPRDFYDGFAAGYHSFYIGRSSKPIKKTS